MHHYMNLKMHILVFSSALLSEEKQKMFNIEPGSWESIMVLLMFIYTVDLIRACSFCVVLTVHTKNKDTIRI